jgi:hypothetical protein
MRFKLISIFWAIMVIGLWPWQAGADPYYIAALNNLSEGNPIYHTGTTPQTAEYTYTFTGYPYPGYSMQTGALAGSVLKSYTHQQYSPPSNYIGNYGVAAGPALAEFVLNDIIISGPAPPSGTIPVSVNLSLNGTLTATTTNSSGTGYFDTHAWVQVNGGFSSNYDFSGEMEALSHSQGGMTTNSFAATGILSSFTGGFPGSGTVTTPSFNLTVGPHAMSLTLSTRTDWLYDIVTLISASGDANVDFFHSLSFATSGDVFNLPSGYTVNSVSGNIVNNRFVGASAPVPPSLLLLGSGLLGLLGWRRFGES